MRALVIKPPIAALALALGACPLHATEHHVSTAGLDANPGTAARPFKTISAAAAVAQPGDVITVHEGVYRERVNPPRGGASDTERIVYQAAPGEKAVIKGSEVVRGWNKLENDSWEVTLPNSFFGEFNPYDDVIGGEWYRTPKGGFDHHTGAVYLNGRWLDEARDPAQMSAPAGDRPLWIAKVDDRQTTIRAQFSGVDPNRELVEINVRQSVFYPAQPGRNYITVRGFTMCQAATPWSGAMSEQVGLVGTHWSKGWIIEDNVISHSMNTGVTLGRYDLAEFGITLPPATAPGFVRSCELALAHGWSKERIGGHVVRNNHISHCEKNGIHGSLGGIFSTIEGRKTPYFKAHSVGDMKLSDIRHKDLRFLNNLFAGSDGLAALGPVAGNLRAAGNVHLAGARPATAEEHAAVDPDFKPRLKLKQRADGWWLEMAVDPAWISGRQRPLVTSDLLGRARITGARFEQPDGSSYRLDADYHGRPRNTANPAPGPFEITGKQSIRLEVWPGKQAPAATTAADAAPPARPNFVLIIGDDISVDDFGCYGHPHIRTPNVDRLAAGGMRFTNAYLTTSQCSPTRCSLITGRYPHNTGAPELHMPLPEGQVMFPAILKEAGYHTAAAGKWHLGKSAKPAFDTVVDSGPGGEERWVDCLVKRPQDKPFFMWFASHDAHRGWAADKEAPPHRPEDVVIPPFLIDKPAVRKDMAQYYDEVQRLDRYTGLVVAELGRQGVLDNTCILFMADNGRPFPRCKTRLNDSGIKTPFIVHWPAGIGRAGSVCESLLSAIDIAPTVLGLAGVKPPPSFQGLSIEPLLEDPSASIRELVFAEHNWHGQLAHERMVRRGDFVYIRNAHPRLPQICGLDSQCPQQELRALAGQGKLTPAQLDPLLEPRPAEELFRLGDDPHQLRNLASTPEHREVLGRMRHLLDEWQRRTGDTVPAIDKATPDRYDRRTGKPIHARGGRPSGGIVPGETSNAMKINDPGPR